MDNGASSYRRFLTGDDSALVDIIRDYKDGLMLYINGFVGDIHTAEELMIDVFSKLAVKRPRFSESSSFKTWLYAIGRNMARDYMRKSRKSLPIDDAVTADVQSVEEAYLREERKIMLHRALSRLKPEHRQILYLVYFEDFTNMQAAKIMGKSRHQTENLIYRAKQALKSQIDKEGFVNEGL